MARPSKYEEWITEDGLTRIRGWARDGCSNKEIAHNIGIKPETFSRWCERFNQLSQTIKKGREPVLIKLEDNMLSRTQWRQVDEITDEEYINSAGEKYKRRKVVKKWVPPDTAMMIFLAKNYMPNKYRDKPVEVSQDQYEDDGLIDALECSDSDIVDDGDMIVDEE